MPYARGTPNVQIGMGPYPMPEGALNIAMIITATPHGNCGISVIIAGNIQPGTHTSGNMDGFVGGGMGFTELGDPIGTGLTGTLVLEQADDRFLRGSFELTQAFENGSTPSPQQDGSGFPTRASSSPLSQNKELLVIK